MVETFALRTSQKNAIFEQISRASLPHASFVWDTATEDRGQYESLLHVPRLVHQESGYFFQFMPKQSIYSPGTDNNHTTHKVTHGEWWRTEDDINDWLAELRKEVDAPDLWNEFQQQKEFAASLVDDGTDSDTPFTQPERKQIIEALDDIKKQLVNMRHWDVQQAAIIDNQFKHMEEASNRIGRKDWMLFIYGSIMSVLINLSVTPEQGHAIMALADSLMRPVFHKVNLLD